MCNCIDKVNEALKPHKKALDTALTFGGKVFLRAATVTVPGGKATSSGLVVDYCPFCGVKWEQEE